MVSIDYRTHKSKYIVIVNFLTDSCKYSWSNDIEVADFLVADIHHILTVLHDGLYHNNVP